MVVACEKCDTRFRLPGEKIPADGLKVRCSKCHHRFHVKPGSAVDPHEVTEREVEDIAPGGPEEEPDLDNPEFLHEELSQPRVRGATSSRSAGPPLMEEEESSLFAPETETPGAPPDSGPSTATMTTASGSTPGLDLGDAFDELRHQGPFEEGGTVRRVSDTDEEDEPSLDLFGPPPEPSDSAPEISSDPGPIGDEDEALGEPEAPFEAPPRPTRGRRPGLRFPGAGWMIRIAAVSLGLLLLAGAARVVVRVGSGGAAGPLSVRGAGWVASDFQAFHVRDPSGRRILVLRGALRAEQPESLPLVTGTLLSGAGRALGGEVVARPRRLEDDELVPERLKPLLRSPAVSTSDQSDAALGGVDREPDGFTLLFPGPPPSAQRVLVQVRPR